MLKDIAALFVNVGLCEEGVNAYVKCSRYREAIEACIRLNDWQIGLQLARRLNNVQYQKEMDTLLDRFVKTLLERKEYMACVELYRKAGYFLQAAQLLYKVERLAILLLITMSVQVLILIQDTA